MADNIITPEFRAGFISVFRATKNAKAAPDAKAKYSIRACFPPTADLTALKQQAQAVAIEKWGAGKTPKAMRSPFRLNEELENPVAGIGDDWIIMTFSANEDRRPGLVDADRQDIIDESEVYAGAWFRAQIHAFAYDNAGNKGITFGLDNVQKMRDDDPIGGGRMPASKAFEAVGGSKTASDMFA